jgi:hypothetical protein
MREYTWGETGSSVYSVIKRMKEREKDLYNVRIKISNPNNFKIQNRRII